MNFCVLCSKTYPKNTESNFEEYKDTCVKCRKILLLEAPGVPLYGTSWGGTIDDALEELEFRIPSLFNGPECPLEYAQNNSCDCTYLTGCKALKEKDNKKVDKSSII